MRQKTNSENARRRTWQIGGKEDPKEGFVEDTGSGFRYLKAKRTPKWAKSRDRGEDRRIPDKDGSSLRPVGGDTVHMDCCFPFSLFSFPPIHASLGDHQD